MTKETNLIDVKALSDRLSVSERTVYDLVRDGEIPYFKVGRLIRFDYPSVLTYLKVSPDKLVELPMLKPKHKRIPLRRGEETKNNYEQYVRGARNPFKNYDDFGNLIAKDGDE